MSAMMKRIISFVLCFVLVAGLLPFSAFAVEAGETVVVEVPSETTGTTEPSTEATESKAIAVTGIALDQTALEVGVGEQPVTLTATVLPEDATDKTVTWTSSEPGVVSVVNGVLTFGYIGEAVITATAGEFSASCTVTVGEGARSTYDENTIYVLAGGDYQPADSGHTEAHGIEVWTPLLEKVKSTFNTVDGFLFTGDYVYNYYDNETQTQEGFDTTIGLVQKYYPNLTNTNNDMVWVQGNHDYMLDDLSDSGANDAKNYGVYVLHEDDFPAEGGTAANIKKLAEKLSAYLTAKVEEKYDKPIFVLSHVPLHFGTRTNVKGDGKYSDYIVDALNAGGEAGLNIVFLFGHNHSSGYDEFLGGEAIYIPRGGTMPVAEEGSTTAHTNQTLNFTYMNSGYVSYYSTSGAVLQDANLLTMTVFEISDNNMVIHRLNKNGNYNLGSAGEHTGTYASKSRDLGLSLASATLGPQTVELQKFEPEPPVIPEGYALDRIEVVNQGNTKYFLNDTLDTDSLSVVAVYTMENATDVRKVLTLQTAENEDGYTISGVDMSKAGKQYVTVTYGEQVGTFAIEVYKTHFENETGTVAVDFTNYGITSVVITEKVKEVEGYSAYVTYDITPAGYTQGDEATVTVVLDMDLFDASRPVKVLDQGNVIATPNIVDGKISFTTNHFTEYDVAQVDTSDAQVDASKWEVVIPATDGTTTYAYTLATSIDADGKYVIVGSNNAVALMNNNGTMGTQTVTISGSNGNQTMTSQNVLLTEWTFSGSSSAYISNNGSYLRRNNNNFQFTTSTNNRTSWTISNQNNGQYRIYNSSRYIRYSGSSFGLQQVYYGTYPTVRLFVRDAANDVTVGGTGATYGQIVGATNYQVALGTSEAAAVQAVKDGMTVYYTTDKSSTTGIFFDDDGEGMSWEMASNYDPNTAGSYTVTIKYNNVELGTATVEVVARKAQSVTLDKYEGTVERDSGAGVETGAYLSVLWEGETTPEQIPVTVGMLTGNFNVQKNGTYTGLSFSYAGQTFENFTLKVVNKTGVDDFPLYPNPGSIDLKKNATGVDFQNTGIARVELSTSGLPSGRGVDVVVVLDMSSSMKACIAHGTRDCNQSGCPNNYRVDVLRRSLLEMIAQFNTVNPTTGKAPDIDIAIIDFNGYGPEHANLIDNTIAEWNNTDYANVYTGVSSPTRITQTTLSANNFVSAESLKNYDAASFISGNTKSGTNYDDALKRAYYLLDAKAKANTEDREQFVIFMSDGAPFGWNGINEEDGDNNMQSVINYYWWDQYLAGNYETLADMNAAAQAHSTYKATINTQYEFLNNTVGGVNYHRWAEAIKGNPVTDYTVYDDDKVSDGEAATKDDLFAVKGLGATIYSIGFSLVADTRSHSGYTEGPTVATMEKALKAIASEASGKDLYEGCNSEDELTNTFKVIAGDIAFAATNARFVDQMGDSFNLQMNPEIRTNATDSDGTIETTTDITITTRPVYTKEQVGTTVDGYTVKQDDIGKPYGNGTTVETVKFAVDSNGKITATTTAGGYTLPNGTTVTANSTNILVDGVIYGKNFFYNNNNAAVQVTLANGSTYSLPGETFYWNIGTINEVQYTIAYTVYLEGAMDGTPAPGSYATNNFAILYYTNHVGNEVSKSIASPSVAWEGANVSYAFYLVDNNGNPVHADGTAAQNFLQAHKITQPVVYQSVELNADTGATLTAAALAVLPAGYELYAPGAVYHIEIGSGDGQGANISRWTISGDNDKTTYVVGYGGANDYSNAQNVSDTSYDYTHTTVYFAVKWVIGAVQDTVVVDYGLSVDINVMANDMFGSTGTLAAVGLNTAKPESYTTGLNETDFGTSVNGAFGTAVVKDGKIRYTLNNMQMNNAEKLAYAVDYAGEANPGFYYGDLTIIPATTVYYEDEYVTLKTYIRPDTETKEYTEKNGWPVNSVAASGTQAEDRPGSFNLGTIDANNIYGYDKAYDQMSTHSMGNSAMIHVDATQYGTAEFSFWGTGFDVISTTSNKTGTLVVQVYDESGALVKLNGKSLSNAVDTYYGYTYGLYNVTYQKVNGVWTMVNVGDPAPADAVPQTKDQITSGAPNQDGTVTGFHYTWKAVNNDPNALYQVPVIQYSGLPYAKYNVKITALYYSTFDATAEAGYDLYLDAIRIYDPAGTGEDKVVSSNGDKDTTIADIYAQDGEAWPSYHELRDLIITATKFDELNGADDEVEGIIFIDGDATLGEGSTVTGNAITDYTNFGPNNELYLAKDQAVAFNMNLGSTTDHPGYVPVVRIGLKTVGGKTAVAEMWNATVKDGVVSRYNAMSDTLETATDMYYDITVLNGRTVVIKNSGEEGSVLSITNIKLTYKPSVTSTAGINEANTVSETEQPAPRMFSISRSAANAALMSLKPVEEEIPEETVPEETIPEETIPEETVPEETVPEETIPEETVPEETVPEETKPNKDEKPAKPGKPEKEEKPTKPGKPEKEEKPTKPGKPEKEEKPTKPSKPEKEEKPAESGKPAKEEASVQDKTPAESRVEEAMNKIKKAVAWLLDWLR